MSLPFSLLLITDEESARSAGRSVVETVALALSSVAPSSVDGGRAAGSSKVAVLLRDKAGAEPDIERAARALLPIVRRAGARLLVHTHAELAARLALDGVHLDARVAASSPELFSARVRLPAGALLGASRHAGDALEEAALAPLDYVTMSPVFSPASKPDDVRPPLGLDGLAAAARASARPLVALGGVTPDDARACLEAGAAAVAVLGGVMAAEDPGAALSRYLAALAGGSPRLP